MTHADQILKMAGDYHDRCSKFLIKVAKIKKLPGGKYRVVSQKGKNLGTYKSETSAKKRLRQVEFFKHLDSLEADDSQKETIDLSDLPEFSLSAILRELNKEKDKKIFKLFLKTYKLNFDKGIKNKVKSPDQVALQVSFLQLQKLYNVKVNKKIIKNAADSLGNPVSVGKYLSDIVKFTLNRISPSKRGNAINKLKQKFYYLNENEIALKKMPASSAMGQSITFVKTVLFQHDARYIREVLNNLVRFL